MAGNNLTLKLINKGIMIENSGIVAESMLLNQSVFDFGAFKLGGCNASYFSIQVFNPGVELKNEEIQVYIRKEGAETDVSLFRGKITTAEKAPDTEKITIEAYDAIGIAGDKQATVMPIEMGFVFQNLMTQLQSLSGISVPYDPDILRFMQARYYPLSLSNDEMTIAEALRGICEANGVFGWLDGTGTFRWIDIAGHCGAFENRTLAGRTWLYYNEQNEKNLPVKPGKTYVIYSSEPASVTMTFILDDGSRQEIGQVQSPVTIAVPDAVAEIELYTTSEGYTWKWREVLDGAIPIVPMRDTKHEAYTTGNFAGVKYFLINEAEDAEEKYITRTVTDRTKTGDLYVIKDNPIFSRCAYKIEIARIVAEKLINLRPFTPASSIPSIGYPGAINLGDMITNGEISTYVFNRTLTGIQGLKDNYSANVEKETAEETASESTSSGMEDGSDVDIAIARFG